MRFLDYAGHRQNGIICPRCGSHPRHRALWTYLADQLARLEGGSAILHLSAEQNLMPVFKRRNDLRYVTSDLKLESAMVRADAARLPFQSNSFRLIVSSHMLEHIENDRAVIAEFARTLTPGGEAVVMVPTRPDWRTVGNREFGAPDPREGHWRLYGCDFTQRLRASGLEDRTIPTVELACAEAYQLMDDAIFIARKPLARAS